ncbi:MAG: hypothetical protein KDB19_11210, partial [Microthrixaceae bacterium]|nr:hypothetical protein [Microthrixaceae bacterium]
MGAGPLDAVVSAFIADVGDALADAAGDLDGVDPDRFHDDVTVEAFNLTVAMIDADQRHTDEELDALIDAFGPRLTDSQLIHATPETLRGSSLVADHRRWLEVDSELFTILVESDSRRGTTGADRYYE